MDESMVDFNLMNDNELLDYLDELEKQTRNSTVCGDAILTKLDIISRQVQYRHHVDKKIKEKLDIINNLL